jgi:tripartite-type tricarboxylate transporter receptor subunit TctC
MFCSRTIPWTSSNALRKRFHKQRVTERHMRPNRLVAGVLGVVAGVCLLAVAHAQDFPKTHIKLVLGFGPGTGMDILGRILADKLTGTLPPGMVVENRPGAGGRIATKQVIDAESDGHTLALGSNATLIIGPTISTTTPYVAERDLAPVAMVGRTSMVLVVSNDKGAKSLDELIAKLRKEDLTFGSTGAGTLGHLSSEVFLISANLKAAHVAYRGSSQSLTDVLRGEVAFAIDSTAAVAPFLQNNSLRPLAVTGTERLNGLPDVKTFAEQGVTGMEIYAWWAVMAPAATPKPILQKIGDEIDKALASEDTRTRMSALQVEPVHMRGEALREFMVKETAFWQDFVRKSGFRMN